MNFIEIYSTFSSGSTYKESTCNADVDSIPGLQSSPGEGIGYPFQDSWASMVSQMVKNPCVLQETWFQPLDWEDSLWQPTAAFTCKSLR